MSTEFPGQFSPIPGSFQELALSNSVAVALTLPTAPKSQFSGGGVPKYALVQVNGPNVNWRDDGVPTAGVGGGMVLLGGANPVGFAGNLATAQFISTSGTGSTLLVSYYY
jgi:hypothetical protein